jgi:hypothetical protein
MPSLRVTIAFAATAFLLLSGFLCTSVPELELPALPASTQPVSFEVDVRPVFENRCAVCHACYDAPCQLVATSYEALTRGASKTVVYDTTRLREAQPTRLGLDAHGVDGWRGLGFFSALQGPTGSGDDSLLLQMLALGRAHEFVPGALLPAGFPLDINRALTCAADTEMAAYAAKSPLGGMPYGTAELSDEELTTLTSWVRQGAPGPGAPAPLEPAVLIEVKRWETLLNGETLKQRVVARYLWEHWVFAHLYFEDLASVTDPGPFFQIVRSATPPGEPVKPIASRRPYDDPGVPRFWYRLTPIRETIVHKTHIVYPLSNARIDRLVALFYAKGWEATRFPAYGHDGSNPFTTFDEIPARSRYQFLLDDARYFVMTFIRGPVCRGQVAVDVIQDQFFVAFADPDRDPASNDPEFLERTKHLLALPAEDPNPSVLRSFMKIARSQDAYLDERERYYDEIDPERHGPALDWIWDGDGTNPNAMLTVLRHFDSAIVGTGWIGQIPKTAWVIDYPIFERIYYDLVANYDVYGSVSHQITTRLYMDHLRLQSEVTYLGLLPADEREKIRQSWYVGATRELDYWVSRLRTLHHATQIPYEAEDPHPELIQKVFERNTAVAGPFDFLNRCFGNDECDRPDASPLERRAEALLRPLTWREGGFVALLPEASFLRVRGDLREGQVDGDAVYTLAATRDHTNVASMFGEEDRRRPWKDRLMLLPGYATSYPNFAFDVPIDELDAFTAALAGATEPAALTAVVDRWGVRRTSARFWQTIDWFTADFRRRDPVEAGLFDLQRYENL